MTSFEKPAGVVYEQSNVSSLPVTVAPFAGVRLPIVGGPGTAGVVLEDVSGDGWGDSLLVELGCVDEAVGTVWVDVAGALGCVVLVVLEVV